MKYQVKDPEGQLHIIDGPEGATPDQVIAQAQKLIPTKQPSFGQMVGSAAKDVFTRPAAFAKDLGTNPESMANAMPALGGMAGAMTPFFGGATMGTGAGEGLRDLSLKAMNKPIPSLGQHGMELGGALAGDVSAVPALKALHYGGQIGDAEKAAGVVTRAPMSAVTPGTVGKTLNGLEQAIDSGAIKTPQAAKDAKAIVSQIFKNKRIYEQTPEISVQSARVSAKVQDLINKMIPARAGPSQAMGQALKPWNMAKKGYMSLPWALRHGAEGALGWEGIKKILGQ